MTENIRFGLMTPVKQLTECDTVSYVSTTVDIRDGFISHKFENLLSNVIDNYIDNPKAHKYVSIKYDIALAIEKVEMPLTIIGGQLQILYDFIHKKNTCKKIMNRILEFRDLFDNFEKEKQYNNVIKYKFTYCIGHLYNEINDYLENNGIDMNCYSKLDDFERNNYLDNNENEIQIMRSCIYNCLYQIALINEIMI
jgi:hypothetical protein